MNQPRIEIILQSFQTFIVLFSKGNPEEFIQHCAIETLNKAIGSGCSHFGTAMVNVVQFQEHFKGMIGCAAKLRSIISQYRLNPELVFSEKWKHIIV